LAPCMRCTGFEAPNNEPSTPPNSGRLATAVFFFCASMGEQLLPWERDRRAPVLCRCTAALARLAASVHTRRPKEFAGMPLQPGLSACVRGRFFRNGATSFRLRRHSFQELPDNRLSVVPTSWRPWSTVGGCPGMSAIGASRALPVPLCDPVAGRPVMPA
jgi:hypothetical protein